MYEKNQNRLVRRAECLQLTGLSKSVLNIHEKKGLFVPPIKIGARAVAYPLNEIETIMHARMQGQSDAQLRQTVSMLLELRKPLDDDGD